MEPAVSLVRINPPDTNPLARKQLFRKHGKHPGQRSALPLGQATTNPRQGDSHYMNLRSIKQRNKFDYRAKKKQQVPVSVQYIA
jgi:hypothetical protein